MTANAAHFEDTHGEKVLHDGNFREVSIAVSYLELTDIRTDPVECQTDRKLIMSVGRDHRIHTSLEG